jgi:hypothetical protein
MSELKNPNDIIKYCIDCTYFKKKWDISAPFDRCEYALCTKHSLKEGSDLDLIHPKYQKTYYRRAKQTRRDNCCGNWWEPKKS